MEKMALIYSEHLTPATGWGPESVAREYEEDR